MTKLMTKDEVVAELRRLQNEGHSMKIKDFDNALKYSIQRNCGGYKALKAELGIETKMEMTEARRMVNVKYDEQDLLDALIEGVGKSTYAGDIYHNIAKGKLGAIYRRYGGVRELAKKHGIKFPPKKDTREWTEERIESELRKVFEENGKMPSMRWLKENGKSSLVSAVKRNYGTWNEGIKHFGYKPFYNAGKMDWTREELIEMALKEIAEGCDPYSHALDSRIRGFRNQVTRLFGSYGEFKRQAGYCVISTDKPVEERPVNNTYRPDLRTKAGFKREILRLWYVGTPLNYATIQEKRGHLLKSARALFGGWRNAVEYSGIDYESICVSDNRLSEAGEQFEKILGEILTELGTTYEKYAHKTLAPDFVLPNGHWVDAKLSEWTDYEDMLKRYLPECEQLTVVYLRGSKTDRIAGSKYRHRKISVYKLIDRLDESRRNYYENKLAEIETEIKAA